MTRFFFPRTCAVGRSESGQVCRGMILGSLTYTFEQLQKVSSGLLGALGGVNAPMGSHYVGSKWNAEAEGVCMLVCKGP